MFGIPAKNRVGHLQNTSLGRYRYKTCSVSVVFLYVYLPIRFHGVTRNNFTFVRRHTGRWKRVNVLRVCSTQLNDQKSQSAHVQTPVPVVMWVMYVSSQQQVLYVVPMHISITFNCSSHRSAYSSKNFWFHSNLLTSILFWVL